MNNKVQWNEVWKKQMEKRLKLMPMGCDSKWKSDEEAKKFWEMTQKSQNSRIAKTLESLDLEDSARILDVGAGPGNLALPFALRFAHVTAVEPADGMVNLLKFNARERNLSNISVVQKVWEDIDIEKDLEGKFDLVIASFSLGMTDIRSAVEKMVKTSSKYVCLMWFAGNTPWEKDYINLWQELHNEEYVPLPKIDVLFNVLYQMGIYPEVSTFKMNVEKEFSTIEEAVVKNRENFKIKDKSQEEILYKYFSENLTKSCGKLNQKSSSTRVKLWWKV